MKRLILVIMLFFAVSTDAATYGTAVQFLLSQVRTSSTSLSGGKAYFYAAGTTTLKTIWLDRSKSTPAANPYTLDANGTAQLFADGLYRIVIKDSAGVTKYDRDNLSYSDFGAYYAETIPIAACSTNGACESVLDLVTASTSADYVNKRIVVSSPLSAVQSNISSASGRTWPSNRTLYVERGGSIGNTTSIVFPSGTFTAGDYQVFSGSGTIIVQGPSKAVWYGSSKASTLVTRGGLADGVTWKVNRSKPFQISNSQDNAGLPHGIFRGYSSAASTGTDTQRGHLMVFDVTNGDATSAVGLDIESQFHATTGAWHNLQSYVESDASNPSEVAGMFSAAYTTAGATPFGLDLKAISYGSTAPNFVYGAWLSFGSDVAPAVKSHGVSIRNSGKVSATNGAIVFGANGYSVGYRATSGCDRGDAECLTSGDFGGAISVGFLADNITTYTYGEYTSGTTGLVVGATITGASSGSTATVAGFSVASGSLAGGNAAGKIFLTGASGAFTSGENLQVGGNRVANNYTSNLLTTGTINSGFQARNVTNYGFQVTDASNNRYWAVGAKGQTTRKINSVTTATLDASLGDVFECGYAGAINDTTNPAVGQEITIIGTATACSVATGGNINLIGGTWTGTLHHVLKMVFTNSGKWQEVSRN